MSDQLRDRLRRTDPMGPGVPTEPMTTHQYLLEEILSTPLRPSTQPERPPLLRRWLVAAAAVEALAVAAGSGVFGGDGGQVAAEPLVLSTGEAGLTSASCLPVSVEYLAPMPVAFAGTATSVSGDEVVLTVDRWYQGGDAPQVVLRAPQGLEALGGGFPFEAGSQYLNTATEGTVNYCGFSGPGTPELQSLYEKAFPG